jgi:hypothetical protein
VESRIFPDGQECRGGYAKASAATIPGQGLAGSVTGCRIASSYRRVDMVMVLEN